mmetsp:Transcript_8535/g.19647  ORF Transcript_8535/g.19647 Transcript_8535/m.19647 type:complete len:420 (+) Transcript_8535:35-1294(+)
MGASQSTGSEPLGDEAKKAFDHPDGVEIARSNKYPPTALCKYSVLRQDDPDKERVQAMLRDGFESKREDRAVGCFLSCAIGDSLGAPLEFSAVRYNSSELKGLEQKEIWDLDGYNRFRLKPGQWTDDCSMALCIADSLLVHQQLDCWDIRLRFLNWWTLGYCNAFGCDPEFPDGRQSVGLGGNISESMSEFIRSKVCGGHTKAGDKFTSGNGSLMRLAPVPIYFASDLDAAMNAARQSSLTTHQGEEAAECCRLMAYVIVNAINSENDDPLSVLAALPGDFTSPLYSVTCLANSVAEKPHKENQSLDLADRNWNWRQARYEYAPGRARKQPGYIGSYAMDALCMALHCAWTTRSACECMLKAANMRGDADTVADIAGQIAGAMYGARSLPPNWIQIVQQWDNKGDIATKAYKLLHHKSL